MTKKTVKELDVEVSQLKQDFSDLKSQFDQLSVNYKTLAEEHKKCESPKIPIVKCSTCSLTFPKQKDLQKHMKNDHKCDKKFQCEECERIFVEEWKFKAHEKCHKKYECTICEQTFQSDDIRCKHTKIVHENFKLYCHFYNNNKTCPKEEKCVFLHEDSEICKYGDLCDRINCMFKHECGENDDANEEDDNGDGEEDNDAVDDGENESDTDDENEEVKVTNQTFENPSQSDKSDNEKQSMKCTKIREAQM